MLLGPGDFVGALDINPVWVTNTTFSGPAAGAAVLPNFGVITPQRGNSLVVLATGIPGTQAEPGTDFPPAGVAGDAVTLTLQVDPPDGAKRLQFDFLFLSSEFPDFVLAGFNDTFTAQIIQGAQSQTIALANVDSSFFIPVSNTNAAGTGYALFAEDPAGVDFEFGVGLPDAGVTVWQSVDVEVPFDGPFSIQFRIADVGDGILDSAVVLDNLTITAIELLDPDELVLGDGSISSDPEQLRTRGTRARAIAADGVSRMLVRATLPEAGTATFTLEEGGGAPNGTFALPGGADFQSSLSVATIESGGSHYAFAIYRAPDDFDEGGSAGVGRRDLTVRVDFTGANDSFEFTRAFSLTRPPVLLVHGLWSNPATWTFPLASDSRYFVYRGDYSGTNDRPFATNLFQPRRYIRAIRAFLKNNREIAVQMDYAGHSMGGILGRNHINSGFYRGRENYFEGDINRFVTLNTPHLGSPLGNVSVAILSIPIVGDIFTSLASALVGDPSRGAVADLAVGSSAINAIGATDIPGHAMVGTGGSDVLTVIPGWIGAFYRIVAFFAPLSDLFQGLQHDGIVGRLSQEGGIASQAQSIFGGLGSIHTSVPGNASYSTRLVELFNSPPTSSQFASFPATIAALTPPPLPPLPLSGTQGLLGSIAISAPASGTQVAPGASVNVVVDVGALPIDRVAVVGLGVFEVDATPPFEVSLTIPEEVVGPYEVFAIGATLDDQFYISSPVTLNVVVAGVLQGITIFPRDVVLIDIGETLQAQVIGSYSDDVSRDITRLPGTIFQSSVPSVATVSSTGLVTSISRGTSTLIARNGLLQDSVTIDVLDGPQFAVPYCFCSSGSPCGNLDALAGCRNSSGQGAYLDVAFGSSSIVQDDLVLRVENLPAFSSGIVFVGTAPTATPFLDGRLCVLPGPPGAIFRYPVKNAGPNGTFAQGPGNIAFAATQFGGSFFSVGSTRYFQAYYRDVQGPCGTGANLSNALAVTFDL